MAPSHIDTAVTRLLVATRQLLESLTMWSTGRLTDQEVSDIYVKLGNDFNVAVVAFSEYKISMEDLMSVPDDLRTCLESCLGLDPTPENLDIYLPDIRQIIVVLLQGLKDKQTMYKRRMQQRSTSRTGESEGPRRSSAYAAPGQSGSGEIRNERSPSGRSNSGDPTRSRSPLGNHPQQQTNSLPPLPPSSDGSGSRASSLYNTPVAPASQSFDTTPQAQSGPTPRHGLPSRSNLRAQQPLPPPPPDAFRPPRSRPSDVNLAGNLPSSGSTGSVNGSPSYGSSSQLPSRSPGLSPSPLPHNQFTPDHSPQPNSQGGTPRNSPHKVSLTDNPVPTYSTPPKASPQMQQTALGYTPNVQTYAGGQSGPMTPPPRSHRRSEASTSGAAGGYRSPPHVQQQSRFSLDSEIDTPRSRGATRDSIAVSDASYSGASQEDGRRPSDGLPTIVLPPPAPPGAETLAPGNASAAGPPVQQSPAALASLTALQNSEALGRRASKRYSSYHMKQMLPSHSKGPSSSSLRFGGGDVPALPSNMVSPQRPQRRVSRPVPPLPAIPASPVGSVTKEEQRLAVPPTVTEQPQTEEPAQTTTTAAPESSDERSSKRSEAASPPTMGASVTSFAPSVEEPDSPAPRSISSLSGMQVFLQYGRETKKVVLDSQALSSVADLQGVFMSRFDYSPDGMEMFPDVYIKDPVTGVAYHLEEMEDIKPGALLSLNIDPLDQVKQHFDNTITNLSLEIKDLKNNLAHNRRLSMLKEGTLSDRLSPQLKSVERMPGPAVRTPASVTTSPVIPTTVPLPTSALSGETRTSSSVKAELQSQFAEIQSLRRDLGAMRQTYVDFVTSSKESFAAIREQTHAVREVALSKLKGSRPLVNAGKAALEKQSSDTVQAVEEVSDAIDTVKDDVVRRQILPRPGQLGTMRAELEAAQKLVSELKQQVTLISPSWKQTWNQELKNVVAEQQLLQHQVKLATDLEGDISQAAEVFDTLEQYVAQRQQGMGIGKQLRTYKRPTDAPEDEQATVPNLLMEIRTKEADPTKRLRAIELQQRAREKEKADKGDDFQNELSGFVAQRKLKKTGGTEEAERIRLKRQEKSFQRMFTEGKAPATPGSEGGKETGSAPTTPGLENVLENAGGLGSPPAEEAASPKTLS